ncbi:MAG: substrate-binding domain-containing protein [Limisphaerales bacterium]
MSLREGFPAHLEDLLQMDQIDLAITLIEKKSISGIQSLSLLELPPVLLVEKNSSIKSAEELWKRDKIEDPLICFPPGEPLGKSFQQKLNELDVDWFPSIEATSADLIATYVANGLGIGVSVTIPQKPLPPQVRALALNGFPPVTIGALWRGRKTPLLQAFLDELKLRATRLTGKP